MNFEIITPHTLTARDLNDRSSHGKLYIPVAVRMDAREPFDKWRG